MADDPLSQFTNRLRAKPEAPASKPAAARSAQPPSLVVNHQVSDARQAYEAFDNKVRAMNIEIRCFRTGMSYSLPYAHLGGIIFNFRTGGELMFPACAYAITIKGRNLRDILMAINLHTCGFIQDFNPEYFILPEPVDHTAPFVESIIVEVLKGPAK